MLSGVENEREQWRKEQKKEKIEVEIIMRETEMGSVGRKATCGDSEKERR